jgi:hypothetical protein
MNFKTYYGIFIFLDDSLITTTTSQVKEYFDTKSSVDKLLITLKYLKRSVFSNLFVQNLKANLSNNAVKSCAIASSLLVPMTVKIGV